MLKFILLKEYFMRAICLTKYGSIDNFIGTDLPTPAPKRGQVRVRVHSSAVGPADFKVAMGLVKFLHVNEGENPCLITLF
jgi:NADPH:quinone reductase-like Zn-dependent oxidoreductase